jgi:glutaconyl-CoA decarboxylase
MRPYFEKMPEFGRELNKGQITSSEENVKQIKAVEAEIEAEVEKVKVLGFPRKRSTPAAR